MKKFIFIFFASIISITSTYAFNASFMKYSPGFYFTDSDWKISQQTMKETLDKTPDNSKVSWKNPATGAGGYFIPSNTSNQNGNRCRTLQIFSEVNQVTGKSSYRFCYINNEWRIVE